MRVFGQFFLVIVFIVSFITAVAAGLVKFQLLNYNFVTSIFSKNNIYGNLSQSIKSSVENQIQEEGGKTADIKMFTDLITPQNSKDIIDNNLKNLLGFINGEAKDLYIYIPLEKLPKNLTPTDISSMGDEITPQTLSSKFGFQGFESIPFQSLANSGQSISLVFIIFTSLAILSVLLMFLLTNEGSLLISVGVAFILGGLFAVGLSGIFLNISDLISKTFISSENVAKAAFGIVVPVLVGSTFKMPMYIGVAAVLIGLIICFIRKPVKK